MAGLFLILYAVCLTLSPAVRFHQEQLPLSDLRWDHWRGVFIWIVCFALIHLSLIQQNKSYDPLILPSTALLQGWGMMTIYRLYPSFGDKQAIWLIIAAAVFLSGWVIKDSISWLQRLTLPVFILTLGLNFLTLFVGIHPLGYGPNLWLSFQGFYLQPSELLKISLLLFFARGYSLNKSLYSPNNLTIRPAAWEGVIFSSRWMFFAAFLALGVLLWQRDLGAFILCSALMIILLYVVRGIKIAAALLGISLMIFLGMGYLGVTIVHFRVEAWLNPWLDPSGKSYQIIQSLIAIANGGILGKGVGLGHPLLIPISFSDFIFSAIIEENGWVGGLCIVLLYLIFTLRGIKSVQNSHHSFLYLAANGAIVLITVQSLLIMAGNVRLLPLTGVTLPFVSYGGSSLVISFLCLMLIVKAQEEAQLNLHPASLNQNQRLNLLWWLTVIGYVFIILSCSWWSVIRAPILLARSDNARHTISQFFIKRGTIFSRDNQPINSSSLSGQGSQRIYQRQYDYPPLSPIVGYYHYRYGVSGIEGHWNEYLSGTNLDLHSPNRWWQILAHVPPYGFNLKLSLDSKIQQKADELLNIHHGALVLLDGQNGEILAISSHPYFDPNRLTNPDGTANTTYWTALTWIEDAPFINRAVQGTYYIPEEQVPLEIREAFFLPQKQPNVRERTTQPLRLATLAAALCNEGITPHPKIAMAYQDPQLGWVKPDEKLSMPWMNKTNFIPAITTERAKQFLQRFPISNSHWAIWGISRKNTPPITWLMGAALHNRKCQSVLAVVIEEENYPLVQHISTVLLKTQPAEDKP